jgi:hypothetical protein
MSRETTFKVAILWRGDTEARQSATPQNNRFYRIFEELAAVGIDAKPAVYDEAFADEVREQLLKADGVLVWVDPIHQGKTRGALDTLLRDVASRGPWVSAHPDLILKMGVKEVLYRTKHLGWGSDTHLYRTAAEFEAALPSRLQSSGPRVIKQNRGNGGQGVWNIDFNWDTRDTATRAYKPCRGALQKVVASREASSDRFGTITLAEFSEAYPPLSFGTKRHLAEPCSTTLITAQGSDGRNRK